MSCKSTLNSAKCNQNLKEGEKDIKPVTQPLLLQNRKPNTAKTNIEYRPSGIRLFMTAIEQQQLGKTLWAIADDLRGAMNADDFRDYMLSFLFLRYLSNNYEAAA